MIDFAAFTRHLELSRTRLPVALAIVRNEAAFEMTALAHSYIGHPHGALIVSDPVSLEGENWEPLRPRTIYDKEKLHFSPPDYQPLYRSGNMLDFSISPVIEGMTGGVASNDKVARYHEFGTSRMVARPIFARAVIEGLPVLAVNLRVLSRDALVPGAP